MKKFSIGFRIHDSEEPNGSAPTAPPSRTDAAPRRSLVEVYFPDRGRAWSYYNDQFDLHIGDLVYVEGKLEGLQGRVEDVSYSFKIKLSDYKRVVALADLTVKGDFYMTESHFVTFDRTVLPYEKAMPWFMPPAAQEEEYASGSDGEGFPLNDLSAMKVSPQIAERGQNYYRDNKVLYLCLDKTQGRAIVRGTETYEVEFSYADGVISDLVCSCYCPGACKHEVAAMLLLQDILKQIEEHYADVYGDYFAAIFKDVFLACTVYNRDTGKVTLE